MSKDFDRVLQAGLLHKLKSYGISGQIFSLLFSFLSNRKLEYSRPLIIAGVSQGPIPGPRFFLLHINGLSDDISNIAIYTDGTTLCSKCDEASDLWQQLEMATKFESDLLDSVDRGRKWLVDFNAEKTQLVSFSWFNNTGAIDVKMDGPVLEEKSYFKMLGLFLSSDLDWSSYIISIAKTASKEIRAMICSRKFLSPEVALYLYKSTMWHCMEYCCHVWADAASCYSEMFDKIQKYNSQLKSFLYFGITLVDVHLNWLNWFHFLFLEGGLLVMLIYGMIFPSPFLADISMSMSTVSFLAQLHSGVLCP